MARSFGRGTLCYVEYAGGTKYLFRSKLKASLRDDFGQTVVTDVSTLGVSKVVLAPQYPKPRIGTVEDSTQGLENSFVSHPLPTNFNGSTKRGSKYKSLATKQVRQRLVYVTINGIKYGWYLNNSVPDSAFTDLGITLATGDTSDIFIGCDFPKPPKVKNVKNKVQKWSTFCDPSKLSTLVPPNWKIVDNGLTEIGQLIGLVGNPTSKDENEPVTLTV